MNTRSLIAKLGKRYPKAIAESYDHPGLQVGHFKPETKKVLLCLDFDDEVFPFVESFQPDLILTHHPFIFGKKRFVLAADPVKAALYAKIEALDIPIFSMHTNFDGAKNGMNDALSEALGLEDVHPLETCPIARGGRLRAPMEVHAFAKFAKKALGADYGFLIAAGKKTVETAAIIGGGGSREYIYAMNEGYDIYISGDAAHHTRRDITLSHYDYLDLPHEIERIFMPKMKEVLLGLDPSLEIMVVDHEKLPEII